MSRESDVGGPVYVSNGGVKVEKSFTADEFPVPAIKFRINSDSEDQEHVRIVDQIPDDFPMEGVGFHPEYESDNWAAYKDHRVEYERTLDPNETVETVYGVRLDRVSEAESFLTEPVVERPPVPQEGETVDDDGVEDILGEDRSQLVRDALQGNGSLADPDSDALAAEDAAEAVLEAEADDEADPLADPLSDEADADDAPVRATAATPDGDVAVEDGASPADIEAAFGDDGGEAATEPRELSAETTPAITRSDEAAEGDADQSPTDEGDAESPAADEADDVESDADAEADDYVDVGDSADAAVDDAADAETARPTSVEASGSLATALAAELREGDVSEEDLELLRSELDLGLPRSADVRIRRLQAKMDDLQAYSDALADFIDEEGTGQEVIDGLRREVESLDEELDAFGDDLADVEAELTVAEAEREDVRDDLSTLEGDLAALDERVEDTAQRVSDVDDRASEAVAGVEELNATVDEEFEAVHEDVDELSNDLSQTASAAAGLDEELGEVREDIAELDGEIVSTRESLESDVEDVRSDLDELDDVTDRLDDIESDIEVLMQFRDRLNDAFGPGE